MVGPLPPEDLPPAAPPGILAPPPAPPSAPRERKEKDKYFQNSFRSFDNLP